MDLKSCQATHSGFVPGLSPQSIAMSLSSPMTSQALHQPQPQPPNLTLFGAAANLHGKATTPLTHIGIVPSNLQSAMLHLSRQQQEQPSGIVLPQNHFNPGTVFSLGSPVFRLLQDSGFSIANSHLPFAHFYYIFISSLVAY